MHFSALFKKKNDETKRPQKRKKFNKLLTLCFRPVIVDGSVNFESDDQKGAKGQHVINYTMMEDKDLVVISPSLSSEVPLNKKGHVKKKGHGRSTFSRILKAFLFRTSLAKKIKKRKRQQKLHRQGNENLPLIVEKESSSRNDQYSMNQRHQEFSKTFDNGGKSVSIPDSLISSLCSSSRSSGSWLVNLMEFKQKAEDLQTNGKWLHGTNTGLCFIVASLVFLVLWGKACAILCTSACLFLVPRRRTGQPNTWQHGVEYKDIDSEEYKKKIIMEGLLDRNHHHGL